MLMGRYARVKLLETNSVYSPFFSWKFFIKFHIKFTKRDPVIHDSVMGDPYMPWKEWRGGKQPSLHQKVKNFHCITRIRFDTFPWNHKADKTRCNFFSTDTNIFFHHSHLVCLENWYMLFQKMHVWLHASFVCFRAICFGRSHSQDFYEISVFENFAQFAGKHMRRNYLFNKVASRL